MKSSQWKRLVISVGAAWLMSASLASAMDLSAAVADPRRSAKFVARDGARHPLEELAFFGVKPDATLLEIWPGGGYWTEILGPLLKDQGNYYVALPVAEPNAEESAMTKAWRAAVTADATRYGTIKLTALGKGHYDVAPAGSIDVLLTFRNLHNWMAAGYAEQALAGFYKALKPGGVLGIEAHRGRADVPQDPRAKSGYVREDYAIALARKAGFELIGKSEINANSRDTKDYPKGVWTLPPVLTLGDKDREKYLAIGEADNFVLKFRKPY
jgi:predicted methyltransferase